MNNDTVVSGSIGCGIDVSRRVVTHSALSFDKRWDLRNEGAIWHVIHEALFLFGSCAV